MFRQVKPDIFADSQRIQQRARLKDQRHAIFGGDLLGLNRLVIDEDFPGIRRLQPDEMLEQDAFAAAARPHDDEDFPRLNLEVNALEHFLPVKAFAQAAHLHADAGMVVGWVVRHFNKMRVST